MQGLTTCDLELALGIEVFFDITEINELRSDELKII
ncbi:hypothetical protein HNR03_001847 [Pseudomonas sp. JAI111]|nr:hypothetical protein [Pseudomonas sp. JAI111]